jgi:hypothetical protein
LAVTGAGGALSHTALGVFAGSEEDWRVVMSRAAGAAQMLIIVEVNAPRVAVRGGSGAAGGQAGAAAAAGAGGAGAGGPGKVTTWITPAGGAYASVSNHG